MYNIGFFTMRESTINTFLKDKTSKKDIYNLNISNLNCLSFVLTYKWKLSMTWRILYFLFSITVKCEVQNF